MIKEDVLKLIDRKIIDIEEEKNLFKGNESYYIGKLHGLLEAKALIGMLGKDNNKTK